MKKLISFLAAVLPLSLTAQIVTAPLTGELPRGGVVYYLPQTGLHLTVTTRVITETPGPYARYAQHCLGIKEVVSQDNVRHEIVSVQVTPFTQPDPERCFYIQEIRPASADKGKTVSSQHSLKVTVTSEGILRTVNMDPAAPLPAVKEATDCLVTADQGEQNASRLVAPMTQEMQLASSTLRMAELAAKQIFNLRETRLALIQGEVEHIPSDGAGLALMLEQLDQTETAYTELFTGSRRENSQVAHFDIIPEKGISRQVAFRFSSQKGVVDKDDLSGRPVYLVFAPRHDAPLTQVRDSIMVERPTKKTPARMEAVPVGLYYYQPVQTSFSIIDAGQTFLNGRCCFAQLGDLMFLEAAGDIKVELNPVTGAILRR